MNRKWQRYGDSNPGLMAENQMQMHIDTVLLQVQTRVIPNEDSSTIRMISIFSDWVYLMYRWILIPNPERFFLICGP